MQVESYALNILENGTMFKEIVEVDVDNQTEVIRVPQHNDVAAMDMMNDFKEVRCTTATTTFYCFTVKSPEGTKFEL